MTPAEATPSSPSPDRPAVFRARLAARVMALLVAGSWLSVTLWIVGLGLAVPQDYFFLAWFCSLGSAAIGIGVYDLVGAAQASLEVGGDGLYLRAWRGSARASWEEASVVWFLERLSPGSLGLFSEVTRVQVVGKDGQTLMDIPGILGSRALGEIEERLQARGFTRRKVDGNNAGWGFVPPATPAGVLRPDKRPWYRGVLAFASRALAGALLMTMPFCLFIGWMEGRHNDETLPGLPIGCCGSCFLFIALAFVEGIRRLLRWRGRRGLHFWLLVACALGTILGTKAGGWQTGREFDRAQSQGDEIVRQIEAFRAATGAYPDQLSQVPGLVHTQFELRGQKHPFQYVRVGQSYRLRFQTANYAGMEYDPRTGAWRYRRPF